MWPTLQIALGGATAVDFALEHPEMVSALVLVGSGVSGLNDPKQLSADAIKHWTELTGVVRKGMGQLAGIRWELDSQGRIKIESKERARERGVPSPDRAEALMLALCKPPRKYEYYSVRDLPQMQSGSGERPNHDDDLDRRPLRSRKWDAIAPGSLARDLRRNRGAW